MSGWGYAWSLSKQQVADAEPPGTVRLIDHHLSRTLSGRNQQEDTIQLIPHPSQSALDPLNWPKWRKYATLLTMSMFCFAANFAGAGVAPALPIMDFQLLPPTGFLPPGPPLSFSKLSQLVSVNLLLTGTSNIFWVPLANTFGRRPVLILSMLIAVLGSIWCGVAKSFGSLLAARVVQGIGFGPADTIAPDVLGEIFFVHERGRAMAIYTFWLANGPFVSGICTAYLAADRGYKYIFWVSAALLGFPLLLEIFLVPETMFDRQAQMNQEQRPSVTGDSYSRDEKADVQMTERAIHDKRSLTTSEAMRVGIYRGNLVQHFLDPWRSLAFPGTWVVMLHYGGLLGGLVTISTVGPQILAAPPYLWGANVGLLSLGGFVGTIVGLIITYFTADLLLTGKAKKESHGLAEPESRLPAMFPALFLATTGIWTFGFCAANPSPHAWAGMAVGYGMVGYGITQIPSIGFNYLIDSYYAISSDCFVMTTVVRGVVSFAWTFFVADWVGKAGAAEPFGIFGMLMGLFALLTIPLWLFGKRSRIATAKFLPTETSH